MGPAFDSPLTGSRSSPFPSLSDAGGCSVHLVPDSLPKPEREIGFSCLFSLFTIFSYWSTFSFYTASASSSNQGTVGLFIEYNDAGGGSSGTSGNTGGSGGSSASSGGSAQYSSQFTLSPEELNVALVSGDKSAKEIVVKNTGSSTITLDISVSGISDIASVDANQITLQPGQSRTVMLSFAAPDSETLR